MFSEEREMWKKFFDMFKKHFNEEVGLLPSVYESDEEALDIDFIVGEESGTLFGVQVMQYFEEDEDEDNKDEDDEDEDDEDEDDEDEDDEDEDDEDEDDEDEDDEDEDDEDEDDEDEYDEDEDESNGYVVEYRFIKTDKKVEDVKDKKQLTLEFSFESDEGDEQIHLDFHGTDEKFTALVVQIEKTKPEVFLEHPDFEF
jgi:hypothetical protein